MSVRTITALLLTSSLVAFAAGTRCEAIVADHSGVAQFNDIPASVIEEVRTECNFFYGHTSHGSQIVTGLDLLAGEDPLYAKPYLYEYGSDLGHNGDVSWVAPTRDYLDAHPACNVVMWSWCGGCSDNTEEGIDIYLNAMSQLETDYPAVTFIYMTGHLDGTGPDGNLYARNNQIRAYSIANDKVLFDFADIESWDPDGTYYPDESDYCNWCTAWCSAHACPSCGCAHSQCFNCYQKGKAFWWMMARVKGWNPGAGAVEADGGRPAGAVELGQNHPNPFNPATRITFTLPAALDVQLEIFSVSGQKVATLLDGRCDAGVHALQWSGTDSEGRPVSSGSYFYRLRAGDCTQTKKMTLLK